jgi:hypothetical protein
MLHCILVFKGIVSDHHHLIKSHLFSPWYTCSWKIAHGIKQQSLTHPISIYVGEFLCRSCLITDNSMIFYRYTYVVINIFIFCRKMLMKCDSMNYYLIENNWILQSDWWNLENKCQNRKGYRLGLFVYNSTTPNRPFWKYKVNLFSMYLLKKWPEVVLLLQYLLHIHEMLCLTC